MFEKKLLVPHIFRIGSHTGHPKGKAPNGIIKFIIIAISERRSAAQRTLTGEENRIFNSRSTTSGMANQLSALNEQLGAKSERTKKKNQKSNVKQIIQTDIYAGGCFSSPLSFFFFAWIFLLDQQSQQWKADATLGFPEGKRTAVNDQF